MLILSDVILAVFLYCVCFSGKDLQKNDKTGQIEGLVEYL